MIYATRYIVCSGEAEKSSGGVNKGYTGDTEECDTTEGKEGQEGLDSSKTYKSVIYSSDNMVFVVGEAEKSSGLVNKGFTGDEECGTTEGKEGQEDLDSSRTYKSAVCNSNSLIYSQYKKKRKLLNKNIWG